MALNIVIMAAGKGTRMKSATPKVLHKLAGRSLLAHVLKSCEPLHAAARIVITGHGAELVEAAVAADIGTAAQAAGGIGFVRQMPQLGTGHAIQQAVPALVGEGTTLILNGDVPLIETATAKALIDACAGHALVLLTVDLFDPSGYGRILRDPDDDGVLAIVEHKDATPEQRLIHEGYSGMMAAPTAALKRWVGQLSNNNAQGEYYLTDIVAMAVAEGLPVLGIKASSETEVLGVNDPVQLAQLERAFQAAQAEDLMHAGMRLADPARFDLRGTLTHGQDVEIDVNCVFEGEVELGDGVRIGANCVIRNAKIAAGARIHEFSHIDGEKPGGASVGAGALIGPFARLRPGAQLGADVHIGNFVEVKNSTLAKGAKANHLAYLGDATVGERVNYGAGAITANYDGANKHRTTIGDDVHVGSNCVLVAPVTLGKGATIGGGSTITKDVNPGDLAVARGKQVALTGWIRPAKKR
ncbi:bifunctional UDP-N-acetylglucosamine diphosphorylase/glucosamine-1-phosphate N-acetyltransferase GlmU [Pelomonas aquatica]|jgi:bifunctional UDP-N-acetylglucosamine pyrophosphorylase/glucosamine-1-phosphate N-acetyltransferase|uniref:Bifunctional protein GlmU n=1 Tax=Pelomonas aquatica TaxID=431058 RepID=A0A9X4LLN7_9BURK|nr:bifunctional UDP-N-acetylglucosamine diphosphorylase/glucosamine-1-phosphate N-acetyltransferase GlmU [Pelomonas aquatica]MCY4754008.1 bifunctional UDP-N-acetylglucosamine diphosphorylase/glucosamine-1-phosphate N-acetyltransferase GlmU [Pelomonas aquatica]MDG0864827.1 UDP-N-acetylglucosamine diphosphorylase/glucosamine-1-phosphate N-acetyltransferase [Pelomonas aquatica]